MYIDHDIIIEETLPAMLQENIADLERYYAEDNWAEYLLLQELFEATVKQFCINGKKYWVEITGKIFLRFPCGVSFFCTKKKNRKLQF